MIGGGPVSFRSVTKALAAQWTAEAKLITLSYGAQEAVHVSNIFSELSFKEQYSYIQINLDSTGILALVKNSRFIPRTKHVALRWTWVDESEISIAVWQWYWTSLSCSILSFLMVMIQDWG